MEPTGEITLVHIQAALESLYNDPNPQNKDAAQKWLIKAQRDKSAWNWCFQDKFRKFYFIWEILFIVGRSGWLNWIGVQSATNPNFIGLAICWPDLKIVMVANWKNRCQSAD